MRKNRFNVEKNRYAEAILLCGVAAGLLGLAYARTLEPAWLQTTRVRLRLPRLHPAFNGYRLVHISDIHLDGWMTPTRLEQVVQKINRLHPDLIVITGDFLTHQPDVHSPDLVRTLRLLRAADGVAAVHGNHDHWSDPEVVRQAFEFSGINNLNNRFISLVRGQTALHIAGVDDYMEGLDDLDLVLSSIPDEGAAILLAHEPDFADLSSQTGRFDLQLSGHSHGGQINLPVVGPPFLPEHAEKYPQGYYNINGMALYTNRGLGMVHLPLRLNSRPEITLFILKSGQQVHNNVKTTRI
jgi:uncharacterized protein